MGIADGNGWVLCRCGRRHWGLHGAAGLLVHRTADDAPHGEVLLQLRAPWVHQGSTWAAPGGAIDSHETPVEAALREAAEEAGVIAAEVRVHDVLVSADHGDWSYHLVLASALGTVSTFSPNAETASMEWVAVERVAELELHPGFEAAWPAVLDAVRRLAVP